MTRTVLKIHTWMALGVFLPLLLISLTGSILVFKHEIDSVLMPTKVRVANIEAERLDLDTLEQKVQQAVPNYEIAGWVLFQDHGRADLVYTMQHGTSDWSYLLLDQYTGEILAEPVGVTHYLTDWLLSLHYTLLLDHTGILASAIVAIIMCLLGITGVIIYRKFWKNFFILRWNRRMTVWFTDLHKMTGIISTPIFLILGITGGYWNITHFYYEEFTEHDHEHHIMVEQLYPESLSLQNLLEDATSRIDSFTPTYIGFPYEPERGLAVWGDVPTLNFLASEYSSTVFYSDAGKYKSTTDVRELSAGALFLDSFRRLHYGTFGGLPIKILWCVIGLTPIIFSVTGLTVWYSRKRKRKDSKRKREKLNATQG